MVEAQSPDGPPARVTVVRLPAEIDVTSAHRVGDDLQAAFTAGAAIVVADMTATSFCDSGGVRMLSLAAKRGAESGAELRVVPSAPISRTLTVMGAACWLTVYPSVYEACTWRRRARGQADPAEERRG